MRWRQHRRRGAERACRARRALGSLLLVSLGSCEAPAPPLPPISAIELRAVDVTQPGLFAGILDIAYLSDTALLVLHDNGRRIDALSWRTGRSVSVAIPGRGPGEVGGANRLLEMPGDEVMAIDPSSRRATSWSSDGELLRTTMYPGGWGAWLVGDQVALLSQEPSQGGLRVGTYDPGSWQLTRTLAHIATLTGPDLPCLYCPFAVSPSGSMAAATRDSAYLIRLYGPDGTEQPPIRRDEVAAVLLSDEEVDSTRRAWDGAIVDYVAVTRVVKPSDIKRLERARDAATVKKRFVRDGLRFDGVGRLWVQRNVRDGDPAEIDVFAEAGGFLGTVRLEVGERLTRIRGSRALSFVERPDGTVRVREWRAQH